LSVGIGVGALYAGLGANVALASVSDFKSLALGCVALYENGDGSSGNACGVGIVVGWACSLGVKSEVAMILEVATLNVRAGDGSAFEQAFSQAQNIISSMPGYASHQLQRCLESQDKYLLLVQWQRLEDHTIGFRQSPQYQDWKKLLHHFYEPFPTVEHYEPVFSVQHGVREVRV